MSASPDFYTPWREDLHTLNARTIGRDALLDGLRNSIEDHIGGGKVLPVYLFGPRGIGKSHLITLAIRPLEEAANRAGYSILHLPEDVPEFNKAELLLAQLARQLGAGPLWTRWASTGRSAQDLPAKAVISIEGLDRHLQAMPDLERKELRRWLRDHPRWLLIGTGVGLPLPLTGKDEAFYGAFQTYPLSSLEPQQAAELLDRLVPEQVRCTGSWEGRRGTLVALAGGSPRTLMALGASCTAQPEEIASEHLHNVIRQFTAHYQMRFRDLPPDGQRIVALLADAPRELNPTEMALSLGMEHRATLSKVARRLVDEGVLRVRGEGQHSWYSVSEPLFRYWHEYRTAPWDQTRVGWMGRLLEAVLSVEELSRAWLNAVDPEIQRLVDGILLDDPDKAVRTLTAALLSSPEPSSVEQAHKKLAAWKPDKLVNLARSVRDRRLRTALLPTYDQVPKVQAIAEVWKREKTLQNQPRETFGALLHRLKALRSSSHPALWALLDNEIHDTLTRAEPKGAPWSLDPQERQHLAGLPVLRVRYLSQGKRPNHAALLSMDDIAAGIKLAEVDFEQLISACVQRRHLRLFSSLMVEALRMKSAPRLGPNPAPQVRIPGLIEEFVSLLLRSVQDKRTQPIEALTWAASLAQADDLSFDRYCEVFSKPMPRSRPRGAVGYGAQVALASLAIGQHDRYQLLIRLLSRNPELAHLSDRAESLFAQLDEAKTAHLHPELERLRQLLLTGQMG